MYENLINSTYGNPHSQQQQQPTEHIAPRASISLALISFHFSITFITHTLTATEKLSKTSSSRATSKIKTQY
jgi:hypothetical protein